MTSIQTNMFREIESKALFDQAQQYGYDYLEHVFNRNVFPSEQALSDLSFFDEVLPDKGMAADEVISILNKYGNQATVTSLGGRYFGFVCGSAVPAGLAAKTMATFWDQNTAMYVLSPVGAKLESIVENWLKSILNLPQQVVAGFVSGSSASNFAGLAAARYRLLKNQNWDINEKGLFQAPSLRIITSRQAHSTAIKALNLLGFGNGAIELIDVDSQGRIRPEMVPPLDNRTLLILQAGNVNSGAFDDFAILCKKAKKAGAWVHVDGAFGLWVRATRSLEHLTSGVEDAQSWAVDGHKTLNTPYDCGIILCADQEALVGALHMSGSYLVTGADRDGMFYTPEMSRRARVIELWATMKYLGKEGIDQLVSEFHERAKQFAKELSHSKGFTIVNDVVFNQILVHCETDEITSKVIEKIQMLRECWVGGSVWEGKKVIRISVCSWATTAKDITRSSMSFQRALELVTTEAHI